MAFFQRGGQLMEFCLMTFKNEAGGTLLMKSNPANDVR
jgi:hypothetical protein